jgi:hypothetical protein
MVMRKSICVVVEDGKQKIGDGKADEERVSQTMKQNLRLKVKVLRMQRRSCKRQPSKSRGVAARELRDIS